MLKGVVKTIKDTGYAIVTSENADYFCRAYLVRSNNLSEGDQIEFEFQENNKPGEKPSITNLRIISKAPRKENVYDYALIIDKLSAEQYDKFCNLMRRYVKSDDFRKITTSKLRNIYNLVKKVTDKKGCKMIRPKIAYLKGREPDTKKFMEDLDNLISKIDSKEEVKSFKEFFEALICYAKEIE
ncbi:MAG: CRISPR-associated protein, Csm2 family [candidate division TA06 bacterium 32_111]|uniref:CRISPR system Cms protein Csm2 n=1 Tax=candidate division WOR-3 bacterium TaxID=2052148 RepID=A0A348MLJ6_UNCW3|nr:MAG: CRISPR-associated protein, Csm2 family [candidate division TA06 bacterium 32_111]HAF07922.1 type III-A CRISPR-associated protein Csm2 [candidate division WOR-3 bacterium]HCP16376.1 type III-A CRISPR-associated protein Csm2 [candidate division WOR-3 bacterium]